MAADRNEPLLTALRKVAAGSDGLSKVVARAQALARLDAKVKAALPPVLAPHCMVANIRNSTLVVGTTSGLFAARLRLMTRELLEIARACGVDVAEVRILVGCVPPSASPPTAPPPVSTAARQQLLDAAQKIDDPELRVMLDAFASPPHPEVPDPTT